MQCYWKFNGYSCCLCVFWYGDTYATALCSDDIGGEEPLSLISDTVAMLDTKTINRKITVYIRTLMRNMIRNSVQEELKDVLKTSLKEDSTKDLIRNITLQRMNDILRSKDGDELFHPVNNESKYNIIIFGCIEKQKSRNLIPRRRLNVKGPMKPPKPLLHTV
ncbi:unnamed protein product [Mytilus edulis]|uniref:Uncharacterized protein n=1 Tax=Mytilus edulis TaxID=6550 RepID=A0A8S3QB27_MYTED|nr:unnamed protein product [Mytilus edulis]